MVTKNQYIVILCGGTGPRLWPLSKSDHPKQFLKIFSKNSLLKNTVLRSLKLVDRHHLFIITNHRYLTKIKKDLGKLINPQNIISEPDKKNTSQAIIFALSIIHQQQPQATVCFLPSDHQISPVSRFVRDLKIGFKIAQTQKVIVTFAIKPTFANPSFGYLLPTATKSNYFKVKKFVEKPDPVLAQKLIDQGAYWNSGFYLGLISTFISEFSRHAPEFIPLYNQLIANPNPKTINKIYQLSPSLPIDKAISEKSSNLVTVPISFNWSDVGEWGSILKTHQQKPNQNLSLDPNTLTVIENSQNCLVSGQPHKLIGLVGLDHLAIIDTPQALLVCNLHHSQQVRDLVAQITANPKLIKYFSPHEKK